jgi:HD-GYP domain-containing protein (c-di-GMP phosphodiesterase class II)
VLCAALRARGRQLGVLYLARGAEQQPFTRDDLRLADLLALSLSPSLEGLQQVFAREQQQSLQILATLTQVINLHSEAGSGHPQRVTDYALLLGQELGVSATERYHLQVGVPLHDLPVIAVPDAILNKPGPLTAEEAAEVRAHFLRGAALFETVPSLIPLLPIVRSYRERWDGSGYPDGLAGVQIPLLGRIVGLADAFDAMTTDRPYRQALSMDEAFAELRRKAGTQFDPGCVEAFLRARPAVEDVIGKRQSLTQTVSRDALDAARRSIGFGPGQRLAPPRPQMRR